MSEDLQEPVLVAEVSEERMKLVESRLEDYNDRFSPVLRRLRGLPDEGEEPLEVYALEDGDVVGGVTGKTWADWLHIELLWVAEGQRGSGIGARLVAEAERLAQERGCIGARTETWDFQAPDFYQRLGYRVAGTVEDYPVGAIEYTLVKSLR